MSAHLAQVKIRFWQRVARFRIYTGKLTQGCPFPPGGKKKIRNIIYYLFVRIYLLRACR